MNLKSKKIKILTIPEIFCKNLLENANTFLKSFVILDFTLIKFANFLVIFFDLLIKLDSVVFLDFKTPYPYLVRFIYKFYNY